MSHQDAEWSEGEKGKEEDSVLRRAVRKHINTATKLCNRHLGIHHLNPKGLHRPAVPYLDRVKLSPKQVTQKDKTSSRKKKTFCATRARRLHKGSHNKSVDY